MTKKESESFGAEFFNRNATRYGKHVSPAFYDLCFVEFMKNNPKKYTLLDVGAGSGNFVSYVRERIPEMQITALDPSMNLLNMIDDPSVRKIVGGVPDPNLDPRERFFFIHIKEVLHHLVGKKTEESQNKVKESLSVLKDYLDDSGFMLIHEYYWETWLIPNASRTLLFFFLSVCSKLNIRLPYRAHLRGLVVCFYTRPELESILEDCGLEVVRLDQYPFSNTPLKKLLFLKRWGRMLFVVRKANNNLA